MENIRVLVIHVKGKQKFPNLQSIHCDLFCMNKILVQNQHVSFHSKSIPPSEPLPDPSSSKDKAFVNDKIAAFENKRSTSSDDGVTSPNRRRMERKWSSNQDPPPDVIANGIKVNDVSSQWN